MNGMKFFRKIMAILLAAVLCWGAWQMWGQEAQLALRQLLCPAAGEEFGQHLILVNEDHYIPADYQPELTQLSNGQLVGTAIYPDLQEMFDQARSQGYGLFVREGYRTYDSQRQIMEEKQQSLEQEGYSAREAEKLAKQWVAEPGTSEHQLGLAVDINPDRTISSGEAVYGWLAENAHNYGFIRRYPPDKTAITGVAYEPWHYRYVGREAAQQMVQLDMCLEEYIAFLQAQ